MPRTIKGISARLGDDERALFLDQLMAAEEEAEYDAVMRTWWAQAHLEQIPGRAERLAKAVEAAKTGDRSGFVSLDELRRRVERGRDPE